MTRCSIRRSAVGLAVGLFLVGGAGCGGGRAAVEGTVTYDGAPVEEGGISFVPEGSGGQKATAQIKGGKYSLDGQQGPPPGKYKVEILSNKSVNSKKSVDPDIQGGDTKQILPEKYNKATTLTADIKAGPNTVNFELKSK